jgi:hypothetical protein
MSFSGYYRFLCGNGHLDERDCLAFDHECEISDWVCSHCQEPAVWWEIVDTTNDEGDPTELIEVLEAQSSVCELCGVSSITVPAVYEIPTKDGEN